MGARLPGDLEAFSPAGVTISGTVPGSMAADAGIEPNDRLTNIGGAPVRSLPQLAAALRSAGAQVAVELRFERDGVALTRRVTVQTHPIEDIAGQRVCYAHIDVDGARLRSIATYPEAGAPIGAVLVLQGIACESVDFGAQPQEPLAQLIRGWASAGFITMRVDKRGVGDSEGACCADVDFETELSDHRAALEQLLSDPLAQRLPLLLFGHSVGGMVAPLLAASQPVAGIIVYGTSPVKWLDCIVATTRRQLAMRGATPEHIEREVQALSESIATEGINGRTAAYHRQLQQVDLAAAWKAADSPVLVLRGEHDWVVTAKEQQQVADIAGQGHRGSTAVVDVPGLDHLLGWHASRQDSMTDYGAGRFDPAIVTRTLEWMRNRVDSES